MTRIAGAAPADDVRGLHAFVVTNTVAVPVPLLPELSLHLATEVTPLWQATEQKLRESGLEPPFWAFAWAGGGRRWVATCSTRPAW